MIRRSSLTNAPNKTRIALAFGAEREKERVIAGAGVEEFLELTDTPETYEFEAGKYVRVKANEKELEFVGLTLGVSYTITLIATILMLTLASPVLNLNSGQEQDIVFTNPIHQVNVHGTILLFANPTYDSNGGNEQDITFTNPVVDFFEIT